MAADEAATEFPADTASETAGVGGSSVEDFSADEICLAWCEAALSLSRCLCLTDLILLLI